MPEITGVSDGSTWRSGEIEFDGTGVVSLWIAGLPGESRLDDVAVLLDDTPLTVEYLSEGRGAEPRQVNAR